MTSYNFAACCLFLQLLRLRTADFQPLRSCCQSASDWCMSDELQQEQQEPSVLETLATAAKEDAKEFHGLSVYEGLLVSKPSDYQALSPEIFKFLKEDLSLASHLPKAPSLGECSFLLSKKANLATELFNDTWASASLNYAATAETYCHLAELVEAGTLEADAQAVKAAGQALLTCSNVLARSLQFYKHLVKKQATKDAQKPGAQREQVLTEADAKALSTALETKAKLERLSKPSRGGRGGRGRGRGGRGNRYWRRNRRNGGGGRGRGQGQPSQQQPQRPGQQQRQ